MPRRNRQHKQTRDFLRVIGPLVLGTGVVFALIGFGSFFSAFGSFSGPPRYFWCAFVGLPLIGVGTFITKFAYMGAVTRYMANEITPVGTDVFNTVARDTKSSIRDIAAAIGSGLRDGTDLPGADPAVACPACSTPNETNASFCKGCGASLAKRQCSHCGDEAASDARFCDSCGEPLA
jgi:hypothetical protein